MSQTRERLGTRVAWAAKQQTFQGASGRPQQLRCSRGSSPTLVVTGFDLNSPLDSEALKGQNLLLLIRVTPVLSRAVGQGRDLTQVH